MLRSTRRIVVLAILCLCLGLSFIAVASAHHGAPGHGGPPPDRGSSGQAGGSDSSEDPATQQDAEPEGSEVQGAAAEEGDPDEAEPDGPAPEETESNDPEDPAEQEADEDDVDAAAETEDEDQAEAAAEAALDLEVTGGGTLVQVGRTVTYAIAVGNAGDEPLQDVVVEAVVAPELEVVDAGDAGIDGSKLTWTFPVLAPGADRSLDLQVRVAREGDLRALTDVSVAASDVAEPATDSLQTFIGAPRGASVTNPEPRVFEEFTVTRPREVVVRVEDQVLGSTILPVTGVPVGLLAGLGAFLIAVGLLALAGAGGFLRGTPTRLMVVLLLALTACTAGVDNGADRAAPDTPAPATSPDEASEDEEDEVLGTVVEPDDEDEDDTDAGDAGETAVSDATDAAAETAVAVQTITVQDQVVRRRLLDADEIPVRTLGTTPGSNTISLGWTGSDIATAASSTVLVPDAVAEVTTGLGSSNASVDVEITLTNLLPERRLAARGRFVHEVSGPGGFHATLRSEPIDVVLNPQGTTTYRFTYALPAGDFGLTSRFEANG